MVPPNCGTIIDTITTVDNGLSIRLFLLQLTVVMKRILPFVLLFSAICLSSYAQETDKKFRKRTYLKVNPSTIISSLDIDLEQDLTEKLSLELGVSGIYTDYPDYVFMKRIDIGQRKPGLSTEQFVEGRGLGFRAGMKWYLFRQTSENTARGTYFEPVLFYKKIFYPNEDQLLNGQVYKNEGDKNVYGIQLLLGRQVKRDKFILDPYLGIGIRSKVYNYTNYTLVGNSVNADQTELVNVLPSIHLGIKVGFSL